MRNFLEWAQNPEEKKEVGYGSNCPVCGKEAVVWCRCSLSDTRCENNHSWHKCPVHKTLVIGESNHKNGSACTCMQKLHHDDKVPAGVRKLIDDLSADYKGHLKRNGTVEPWKLLPASRKIENVEEELPTSGPDGEKLFPHNGPFQSFNKWNIVSQLAGLHQKKGDALMKMGDRMGAEKHYAMRDKYQAAGKLHWDAYKQEKQAAGVI